MYRGTTPTVCLTIESDFDLNEIAQVWITFRSLVSSTTFEKKDVKIDQKNGKIYITLTQEETLKMGTGNVSIQARFFMNSGSAWASDIVYVPVKDVLNDSLFVPEQESDGSGAGDEAGEPDPQNVLTEKPREVRDVLLSVSTGGVFVRKTEYGDLKGLPSINGVTVCGDLSLSDIGIDASVPEQLKFLTQSFDEYVSVARDDMANLFNEIEYLKEEIRELRQKE